VIEEYKMKIDTGLSYQIAAMKKFRSFRRKALLAAAAACLGNGLAWANPTGPQVVNGQVSFASNGGVLSVTNSPGSIINWQGFSIQAGEITRFIQQNSSSAVLNRIIGQDPSQILGALQSNGRVFLINPNGILFGSGAQVDVNGLVASTLNISNADFLAGKLNFNAGDKAGAIQNQGTITTPNGGQVYLVAPNIENSGIITSPKGEVVLAAGHTVQLVDSANPDLHVVVSSPQDQAVNLRQIIAQGGNIGIYGALINQRGTVSANSAVVGENGKITFKASGDTLLEAGSITSATGAGTGGEIHILGKRVGLTGNAIVDASGQTGGGTVLVGGDYQGKNPDIQNAEQSYVGQDAQIKADALQTGNGGKVIVWADEVTRVYGSISARGGARSGNGGLVETSGHYLDMQGYVDTRAPKGAIGSLLLDPTNIYIAADQASATAAGMAGTDTSASTGPFTFIASGTVSDSLLTVATLQSTLASSSVTVSTTNASGTGAGIITVVDPIAWSSDTPLTLDAASGIAINAAINGGNGSALNLNTASGNITQSGSGAIAVWSLSAHADAGSVTLTNPNNSVRTLAGYAGSGGFSFVNNQALTIGFAGGENGITSLGSGAINIRSTGALTVNNNVTSDTGNITLEAGATGSNSDILTINGSSVVSTDGTVLLRAGAAIDDQGTVTGSPVTQQANLNSPTPTLSQCIATPTLVGCSAVLPTINQCTVTPTLAGCETVLPTTQTATNQPVTQAINSTINLINTSTSTSATKVSTLTFIGTGTSTDPNTSTSQDPNTVKDTSTGKDDKTSDNKIDENKQSDKKDTTASDKSGVKNEPVTKLYCN
jgi:filamentous hemagglutinin family protein